MLQDFNENNPISFILIRLFNILIYNIYYNNIWMRMFQIL